MKVTTYSQMFYFNECNNTVAIQFVLNFATLIKTYIDSLPNWKVLQGRVSNLDGERMSRNNEGKTVTLYAFNRFLMQNIKMFDEKNIMTELKR